MKIDNRGKQCKVGPGKRLNIKSRLYSWDIALSSFRFDGSFIAADAILN